MKDKQTVKAGVTEVVQKLYDTHGEVRASSLVEAARPKTSPAHAGFEWDQKKAAYQYNLYEARQWIRVVEILPAEDKPKERLVNVPEVSAEADSQEGSYLPMSVVVEDVDAYERARQELVSKIASIAHTVRELDRLARARGSEDAAAILSQLSRGLDLVQEAVSALH